MDKGTQPAVPSDFIAATVSDSSLSPVDTYPGSNLLPTVTALADQVNVEIRQNHPECFSRLPIVVIQRDEVTRVDDKSSNNSTEPSSSSIQSINDSTNCFKRSLLNESLNIEDVKKSRPTENITEGQSNMSYLKSDLYNGKNENDKIVPSINIKIENSSDYKKLSENVVFKDVNVKIEMNKNDKKEIFAVDDAFNLEKLGDSIEFPDNKSLHKSLGSKNTTQSIDEKNNTGKSCKVVFNTEIGQNDKITNELVPSNKTVHIDHQYSKSLSPVNKVSDLPEKIGSFQTNNKINKLTPQESEINHIENNDDKDLQGSVINKEIINQSIMEDTNSNRKIKSDPVDTTNEIPITVNDQGISKLKSKFPIFNLLDDEGKGELVQSITDFSEIIHPEIKELLKDDSVSFEEFEKSVEENISRLMNKEFGKQLESLTDKFVRRTDAFFQEKYDSIKLQLRHVNAIREKHVEDLKTDVNATPRKIRRNMKVQTNLNKKKKNGSHLQKSNIEKNMQNKTSDLSTQASNSANQNVGSLVVMTDSPLQCSSVIAPKVISVKGPKILNACSLPPVPPAIPISIDDDLDPLPSVHHQKCHTFKPIPQAPIKKTANTKSLKDDDDCIIIDPLPIETINLLSPEPLNDDGPTPISVISKKKRIRSKKKLLPALKDDGPTSIPDISKKRLRVKKQLLPEPPTLIILDEDSSEFVNLLSPEPAVSIEESNINVLALQNDDPIPGTSSTPILPLLAEAIEESNINVLALQNNDPIPNTSSMPILPLPAEPFEESNIYISALHIDDSLPSASNMPILPLLVEPMEKLNIDVPVHHSADSLPNISSTLVFTESSKELINNLSVLNIDGPLASTSRPILPLSAESIEESNIYVPMQHNIAPLPGIPIQKSLPSWKPLPPAPELKISNNQTSEDIELIWDIETNGVEEIKSFEVYCYNEISPEMSTSVNAWQKTGDVKFLPLPIKCCLKKGTRNIMCHYVVRAVDVHDRVGPFSLPESVFIN